MSDILWRNDDGTVAIWIMNGTVMTSGGVPGVLPANFTILGVGDFDHDGKADILLRDNTTGDVRIWFMNGTVIASQGFVANLGTEWAVAHVGDFNGDLKADILWWNPTTGDVKIWLMDGLTITAQSTIGNAPTDWVPRYVGDFNGDLPNGKADILWRHRTTGEVAVWFMDGLNIIGSGQIGTVPTTFYIAGVGDFNGDGRADILWRSGTGEVALWLLDATGLGIQTGGVVGTVPLDWAIEGVGDFNGDGKADIVWRQNTGDVAVWLMNGLILLAGGVPGTAPTTWKIQHELEPPEIVSANATTFIPGQAGTFTVYAAGFPTPAITRGGVALPTPVQFVDNGDHRGTLSGTPDPGTGGTYALSFTADNGIDPDSIQNPFTLTVKSPATDISLSPSTVAENQPINTVVGTLSATDPDAGDTQTFTLVAGAGSTDNGSFNILGTQLRTSASLDFEAGSSRSIRVRATDNDGLIFEKALTVTVTNVNEAPTDIGLSPSSVAENQPINTVVGTLSATDPDAGDTFTFTLVAGAGSTDNASFNISGNQLQTSASFNFEAGSSKSIRVRATDAGSLFFEKALTVTVTNVNEAPTDIGLSPSSVAENQPSGTAVGTLSATDPDVGDTFTFTLVAGAGSTDNASFQIVGSQLQTAASLDFEAGSSRSIRVRVTDSGSLFFEKVFSITVTNVNDAPTDITLSNSTVNENQAINTVVGNLTATDQDAGDTHTFTLVAGAGSTDNASFNISGNQLRTSASLNFEAGSTRSVRIRATDAGTLFFEKQFTITVGNLNDPPVALDKNYSAQANMKISIPQGTGLMNGATDEDASPVQALSVSQADISATNPVGGVVTVSADGSFDFEPPPGATGNVTFTYKVCDDGAGFGGAPGKQCSAAKTVTFNVASPVIWFVDPTLGVNGTGTLASPFNSLASANTAKGNSANQRIFVYDSTDPDGGATTAAGVGVTLDTNGGQWLVGQGVTGANFDTVMGLTGGNAVPAGTIARPGINRIRPVIQGTVAMNGNNSVVRGLNITPSTANASGLTGGAVTGVTVGEVDLSTTGTGTALSLSSTGGTVSVGNVTSNGGTAVSVNQGSGTVDVTGTVSRTGAAATGISITNRGSGTITFSGGTKTLSTAGSTAVNLATNTGATINFTGGGLNIDTTTVTGFNATGGGTVNVSGSNNTIDSTTGTAVNLNGVGGTVGLKSVTANVAAAAGAANGIAIQSTLAGFSFTVDGDGSNTALGGNATGGTISRMEGADGAVAGNGVYLSSTGNITLRRMTINGVNQNNGIRGISVTNFHLEYSTVTGTNGNNTGQDEGAVVFDNLLGAATITNCLIEGGFEDNLNVVNTTGTLDRLVITGSTFGFNSTANGNNNILMEVFNPGTLKWTLQSSTIKGARADWINAQSSGGSGIMDSVIGGVGLGNTFDNLGANAHPGAVANGNRILLNANGTHTFNVSSNTLKGSFGNALAITGLTGTASMTGRIQSNDIGVAGTNNSGSTGAGGISVQSGAGSDITVLVDGNDVRQYNNHGIIFTLGDEMGSVSTIINATVSNNTTNTPGTLLTDFNGFHVNNGSVGTDDFTSCFNISDNNFTGGGKGTVSPNNNDLRLRQRQLTTVQLPGYAGPARDNTDNAVAEVVTYLGTGGLKNNQFGSATANSVSTGGGYVNSPGGAACTLPP